MKELYNVIRIPQIWGLHVYVNQDALADYLTDVIDEYINLLNE